MIREVIRKILKSIKGDYFDIEDNLLSDGYISSLELIQLIANIEREMSIRIPIGELVPEELDSIDGLSDMIERYL